MYPRRTSQCTPEELPGVAFLNSAVMLLALYENNSNGSLVCIFIAGIFMQSLLQFIYLLVLGCLGVLVWDSCFWISDV